MLWSGFAVFECFLVGPSLIFLSGALTKAGRWQSAQSKELTYRFLSITPSPLPHPHLSPFPQNLANRIQNCSCCRLNARWKRNSAAPLSRLVTCMVACSTSSLQGRPVALGALTSRDEWGSLYTPPPAVMYWSCLIPVSASPWAARITGAAFITPTCHMTPLSGFNIYRFLPRSAEALLVRLA